MMASSSVNGEYFSSRSRMASLSSRRFIFGNGAWRKLTDGPDTKLNTSPGL